MIKIEYECEECKFHWNHISQIEGKMPFRWCPACKKQNKINLMKKIKMEVI